MTDEQRAELDALYQDIRQAYDDRARVLAAIDYATPYAERKAQLEAELASVAADVAAAQSALDALTP